MVATSLGHTSVETAAVRAWLDELRAKTVWLGVGGLYVGGVILAGSADQFGGTGVHIGLALLAFFLAGGVWLLSRLNDAVAAAALVPAGGAAILAVVVWGGFPPALILLAFPVWWAALAFGTVTGAILAVLCMLLLILPPALLASVALSLRVTTGLVIWGGLGMIWLLSDSLLTAVRWAWSNYERAQAALEEARGRQMQLRQALEDRDAVNVQLTRLNRLAQSLRQIAEDERSAKERFVANVSHELRTPLNMIIGFCEMMINSPKTYGGRRIPPALLADLSVVLRNSQHLSALIDDVLDLSQIEAGRMALTKERVSLAEIIEAATAAIRPLLDSKGLALKVEAPPDLPLVFCDRTRIREVVLNLLSNAGRFTDEGGVTVRVVQDGSDVVVSMADTGRGIADEDRERLFRPFEQLDGTIRRRYGGTGLGLSISKGFVELHEGKMWVESAVGCGTTFSFRLPIDPPVPLTGGAARWLNPHQPYEERGRPWRLQPMATRPRLVVVERGKGLQRLLSRYLDGAEVASVPDLQSAFDDLSRTPAQAVVINEAPAASARHPACDRGALPYEIPAIFCAIPDTEQAAEALGAVGYLVKPISRETLLSALERLDRRISSVLVVDDEPDALQLFARMLAEGGRDYRVLRASSGRQALQLIQHQRPDVILLDLVMPEMDGYAFLAAQQADSVLRDIPVVLISARDPTGQPIVSQELTVRRGRGLSAQEIIASIEAMTAILARTKLSADPEPPAAPRD
jgi:signal transduction histidine kinase/CheY-like chemotaxis protein